MFPSDCRRPSKAHAGQMVRLPRRISIARGNWLTVLIRCAGVSMKERLVATDSSRDSKKEVSRGRSKEKTVSRAKKVNRVNKGSPDSRAHRAGSSRVANRLAAHKMVGSRRVAEIVAASIARDRWVAIGAITANFRQRSASGCVKARTCDAHWAQPVWAPEDLTKLSRS